MENNIEVNNIEGSKICSKCKKEIPFSGYSKGDLKYNIKSACKECCRKERYNKKISTGYKIEPIIDLEGEVWKDVVGFEGVYQISNKARVKSLARIVDCKQLGMRQFDDKIMKQHFDTRKYLSISLVKDGEKREARVHRLVGFAFIPNPENKGYINHKNSIRHDNRLENLEWATKAEDMQHASDKGRMYRFPKRAGEEAFGAKLNSLLVEEIREKYKTGNYTQRKLAIEYNVTQSNICRLMSGKIWFERSVSSV